METTLKGIIIEDEEMSTRHLNYLLEDIKGVEVLSSFENGAKAIPTLNNEKVDFILLDIETPELNGLDFLKFSKDLPAIIFTTANPNYAGDAIEYGAVDFLNKPIRGDYLVSAIEKVRKTKEEAKQESKAQKEVQEIRYIDLAEEEAKKKEAERRKLDAILRWQNVQLKW